MSRLRKIERGIRNVVYDAQIYWKYGTSSPEVVTLPGTDGVLYLDPHDYRARKMIITNCCVRGRIPRNQRFWRMAVSEFAPQTVLDVGLNYGECLLSTTYPSETRLIAFEANLALQPYIENSIAAHPNQDQVEVHYNLVSDKLEDSDFWIHNNWSGTSSAACPEENPTPDEYTKTTVSTTTIDNVLKGDQSRLESLFFKIDVEGYEHKVLRGMQETLKNSEHSVGFIEFDPDLLRRAGEDVAEVWDYLHQEFRVLAFDKSETWKDFQHYSLKDLEFLCGKSFHTDLILVKSPNAQQILDQFAARWSEPTIAQRAA